MLEDPIAERRVGTTLRDKWTLERLLGVGGMAAVYVGVHKIGRREAIKVLHPDIARSPELRARFEQEAHAVNRLKHPGAVAIHDIDVAEDGAPFLVMELLEGESLADRARRLGGIEHGEMLRLVDELLDVLAAAHAQGIIHRDIKPDNLFVQRDGRLKVLDFGIARVRHGMRSLHTRTGAALGTTPYMAPEQIRGVDVDARVDLFAVGATMFRLIAGRRIHEAETESALMVMMATQPAPPLASVAPTAPPGTCLLVDRALAFNRDQRYPDALTMQQDVRALRAGGAPSHASLRANAVDAVAPQVSAPASIRTDGSPAISIDAPTMAAMTPGQAMPAPITVHVRPRDASTSAKVGSKSPSLAIALVASLAVVVGLAAIFFVVRSPSSTEDAETSRTEKANDGSRSSGKPPSARTPSSTAGPTRTDPTTTTPSSTSLPVANGKYRLLLKDGKYPFCVTSALKHAYPVRAGEDGVQVCTGTPDGPVPIEGLRKYDPSEFQWK